MTIVNHTAATHSGLLVTGTGDDLEIDLEIVGGRTLRMSASGDELGAWPVDDCRIEPDPAKYGSFRLVVDGEDAGFTPIDPAGFQALVDRVMGGSPEDEDLATDQPDDEAEWTFGSATEDPVAFLFGSTPPPLPVAPEPPDFDAVDVGPDSSDDLNEPAGLLIPDDEFGPVDVDVITAGVAWESSTESSAEVELFAETEEPTAEIGTSESIPVDAETDELRSRLAGGSAVSRLSAAVGSLRTRDDAPTGDEEVGQYHVGANTVASDVLETQRSLREHQLKEMAKSKWLKWGGAALATTAVIALFAFLTPRAIDFLQSYESDIAPPPEVTTPTSPATTAPTSTEGTAPVDTTPEALPIAGEAGTIFDRPSPDFISTWDAAGGAIDEVLTFDGFPQLGPFEEQFTPYLAMSGIVQPDGTLDGFSLVIDPTGPAEYDRISIQALGVAIATVDPERSPEGRASLLRDLGLNVRQPLLEGIDGTTRAAGIAYHLVYDSAANLLTLTVTPAN